MHPAKLNWLIGICQANLINEKWLLAPNHRIGNQWKDRINFSGTPTVNLKINTLPAIVMQLVAPRLIERQREFASAGVATMLVRKTLMQLADENQLTYFGNVDAIEKFADIAARSIMDYRLAGLTRDTFEFAAIEEASKAADFAKLLAGYEEQLETLGLLDYAGCLQLLLNQSPQQPLAIAPDIILIDSGEMDRSKLESDLLRSIEKSHRVCVFEGSIKSGDLSKKSIGFARAVGEVNEVRHALQTIIARSQTDTDYPLSFDQAEILHTDYETYVPLIHELLASLVDWENASVERLPVTFAEGIACIYSRPGRALRMWVRWLQSDCPQAMLVRAVREGLLQFDDEQRVSFSRLANLFRRIPIGSGASRYGLALGNAVTAAESKINASGIGEGEDATAGSSANINAAAGSSLHDDFGLNHYQQLNQQIGALVQLSPAVDADSSDILLAAKQFLKQYARTVNKLDKYAAQKMIDDIDGMLAALRFTPDLSIDVWSWLEALPTESRVLASGPRGGCLHVDHIARGGHSGRPMTIVLGLDDSRFPKRGGQDPLLLDSERKKLSGDLLTSGNVNEKCRTDYEHLLNRTVGEMVCSHSTITLAGDRELFPSSTLLQTFRLATRNPAASMPDFERHCGVPHSFFHEHPKMFLSSDDWWTVEMLTRSLDDRVLAVEEKFGHVRQGRLANEARQSAKFTAFDGNVPNAGAILDPTQPDADAFSASRLETFGKCPRKYFFQYGLGIQPPDEMEVADDQWLDPLVYGNLMHDIFEDYLRKLTEENRTPTLAADLTSLQMLAREKTEAMIAVYPVPNEDAYQRRTTEIEKTCEIFLREEEKLCRDHNAVPWVFEASFGVESKTASELNSIQPVELSLSDGRKIRVRGFIDRVDRIKNGNGNKKFAIWDYKTGGDYGFDQAQPFQQGRKLQHYLYLNVLRHRLREVVGGDTEVVYFGYFFPSPKVNGRRMRWTAAELKQGDEILTQICDQIANGVFIATENASDCKFCEYQTICGAGQNTAANTLMKLEHPPNTMLESFRKLRTQP